MTRRRAVKVCDGSSRCSGGILQIATGRCEKRQESEQPCCDHRIRPSYVERCSLSIAVTDSDPLSHGSQRVCISDVNLHIVDRSKWQKNSGFARTTMNHRSKHLRNMTLPY
jgi:hypothetical protein